jgi:hypothetical protein
MGADGAAEPTMGQSALGQTGTQVAGKTPELSSSHEDSVAAKEFILRATAIAEAVLIPNNAVGQEAPP